MKVSGSMRSRRLADLIQREIGTMLVEDVQDPRLELVSVSGVRMNRDLRIAEVFYTLSADEERIRQAQKGLEKAAGFLRSQLGRRLKLRYVPELRFKHDDFLEDMVYGRSTPQE